jgi:glutathione S-transferase
MDMTLVIGNKNYSSWSLRPWFYLKHHSIPFDEIRIPLYREDSKEWILKYSPSGKVPALLDGQTVVWDSLAILEYLAEKFPEANGWPEDATSRAQARSLAAEMHSGFLALRTHCGMNCRRPVEPKELPESVLRDIERIRQIWKACRTKHHDQGPWLLGQFGILDAMYAPVTLRFHTYQFDADSVVQDYINAVINHPAMMEWIEAAKHESEIIQAFED